MIYLDHVSKSFPTKSGRRIIMDDVTMEFPTRGRIGLLGKNGAGKTTLMNMISGSLAPDRGRVIRRGNLSWPLGFSGGMHADLSGAQNVRFVARIYGKDTADLLQYVSEFAELGHYMNMPVSSYSSGMRARLAFGLSLGVSFDCYLIDEVTAVGDKGFVDKARAALNRRLENAGLIMVSHSVPNLKQFCTSGVVLHEGTLEYYEDIDDAVEVHTSRYETG